MEFKKTLAFALLYGAVSGSLSIALPLYLDSQGYDLASVGYLFGTATLLSALLGIALAAMGDHFGRRLLISFYSFCYAAGAGIITFMVSPAGFVSGKSISDFSSNNLWNTLLARLSDLSRSKSRARTIGMLIAAFALTYSLSHYLGGYVIDHFGFPTLFLLGILLALGMAATALAFNDVGKRKHRFHLSLNVLKSLDGKLNMVVSFLTGFTSISSSYVIYLFLRYHYNFDASNVGLAIAILYSTWAVASYLLGPYIDRRGLKASMLIGAVMNASAWAGAIFFQDLIPFMLLMFVDNISWPLYGLSAQKLSTVLPEEENVGRDVSIFGFANVLGAIAAAFLGGILAEMSFGYVFAVRAAAVLLSGCIVFFLMKIRD